MNDSRYFPHDDNARNDQKLGKIRVKYGLLGYGIYFCIIEILRSHSNYSIKLDYDFLAFELREDAAKIQDIIENFGLFKIKNGFFYSQSLKDRMANLDKIRQGRKLGGIERWKKHNESKYNHLG